MGRGKKQSESESESSCPFVRVPCSDPIISGERLQNRLTLKPKIQVSLSPDFPLPAQIERDSGLNSRGEGKSSAV